MSSVDVKPSARKESVPKRLGRYDVRAKIGEGGMATVYVGRAGDSAAVALKVIKEEYSLHRDFVNMFLDEAKIVSKLKHPNLIDVQELGSEGTRLFIAMELLLGQSLWHVWMACREHRVRLRYDIVAWIGARVAEGLHHAHELRDAKGKPALVVHRDVNASNIFITYDGRVKVIDFGLAKGANRVSKTAAGVVKGKFAYMSPEQALGKPIDRRTDIFALGVTLWELTVDRRLFKGKDDFDTLRRVSQAAVKEPSALVEGYPPELWRVLKRALDRDRAKRYATAEELAKDLDAFAHAFARDRSEGSTSSDRTSVAASSSSPAPPDDTSARASSNQLPSKNATSNKLGPSLLAEMMRALFAAQRERESHWMMEASSGDRPPPPGSLRPPETEKDETARVPTPMPTPRYVPLPEGLFAPAAVRPPESSQRDDVAAAGGGGEGGGGEDDERAPRPTLTPPRRDLKRTAIMALSVAIVLALAMMLGAWWGRQ